MALSDVSQRNSFSYELDEDLDRGFSSAIRNSQTILALQYMLLINERTQTELSKLRAEVASLRESAPTSKKAASSKSSSTKDEE